MLFELLFLAALMIDWIIGDPKWFPHPVRLIGWLCISFEKRYRSLLANEKTAGIFTSLTILLLVGGGTACILFVSGMFSEVLQNCLALFTLYTFVALKDLLVHSRKVYGFLFPIEKIPEARTAVAAIVGRDTSQLNSEEISRACIETVAENMVDGITAPLFWAVIFSFFSLVFPASSVVFGAIGIALYKAVNTMDSMFGYKNEKYLHFGWFPARFDDFVNFLPARLSGLCIVIGCFVTGNDWKKSLRIFVRDRLKHTSPNAGHTESAIAGGLDIQLGGPSVYFGQEVFKPTMGEAGRKIIAGDIPGTNRIVIAGTIFFVIFILVFRLVIVS